MTNRERFCAALNFEKVEQICHTEHGFWQETYDRWVSEGLPAGVLPGDVFKPFDADKDVFTHFGVSRQAYVMSDNSFIPGFKDEVLAEDDHIRTIRNRNGVIMEVSKISQSPPHALEYPIKDIKTYRTLRDEHLQPLPEKRRMKDFDQVSAYFNAQQEFPVCTHMNGFFAIVRELMGVESAIYAFYDHPEMIREMLDDHVNYNIAVFEPLIRKTHIDFAFVWEDMCFKNGPLVGPNLFREFLMPAYKKLTGFLRDMGVKHVIVDSDGDVTKLIPLWLECGVTGLLPFEVQSGMDVVKLGEEYPQLFMVGGIDKFRIAAGKESIDREVQRVIPAMLKRSGFWVAMDHWVPPEVSLENFSYYCEQLDKVRV